MGKKLLLSLCLFLIVSAVAFGQASARLNGRIVDLQGAVLPGAAVTVTNAATGTTRSTTTNAEGLYSVPALVPGNYDIRVELQGFSVAERHGVELLTGANLNVDVQMTVGELRQ